MGFAYGMGGDQGKPSTPMDTDYAIIKQAVNWSPDTFSTPRALAFNGKMRLLMTEASYRASDVGEIDVPVALVFTSSPEDFKKKYLISFATKVFDEVGRMTNWLEGNSKEHGLNMDGVGPKKPLVADLKFESTNVVPDTNAIMYYDRSNCVIAFPDIWMNNSYDEIQRVIQNNLEFLKIVPTIKSIGYGLFKNGGDENPGGLDMVARPNTFIRISPSDVLRCKQTTFTDPNIKMKYHAYYTYLVAIALWAFVEHVDLKDHEWVTKLQDTNMLGGDAAVSGLNRTIHDYVAYVEVLMFGLVGYGDTKVERTWNAKSISTTLKHAFGFGFTMANRKWWNMEDMLNWENYFQFCTLLGFCMETVHPTTQVLAIDRVTRAQASLIGDFNKVNHGNYPSMGGISGIHFLSPTNDMTWQGENCLPIPVLVNDRIVERDIKKLAKIANNYKPLRTDTNTKAYSSVEVKRGEIPDDLIDWTSMEAKRFVLNPTIDARILETRYPKRDITRYIFPSYGMLSVNDEFDDYLRRQMFIVGLMANGSRTPSEGIILSPELEFFGVSEVRYFTNRLDEKIIDKDGDTDTIGLQEPTGAAGMSGGKTIVTSQTPKNQGQPPTETSEFRGHQESEAGIAAIKDKNGRIVGKESANVDSNTKSDSDSGSKDDPATEEG